MTAKRITSGEVLKYRNGFLIRGRYETHLSASSYFSLTKPSRVFNLACNTVVKMLSFSVPPGKN